MPKPTYKFIIHFFEYALHFNYLTYVLIAITGITSIYIFKKLPKKEKYFSALGIMWFVSIYSIAFIYSIYRRKNFHQPSPQRYEPGLALVDLPGLIDPPHKPGQGNG